MAACSSDGGGTSDGTGPSGTIVISGSSTVQPISTAVAETFNQSNPDVQISVDGPGTGDGFKLFCQGETDISDASRKIHDDEAKACADAGIEYVELKVAIDGLSILTSINDSTGLTCLSYADLYALAEVDQVRRGEESDAQPRAGEHRMSERRGRSLAVRSRHVQ